ncbi:hypothetical protein [Bdellovibrio bacteriovorus]|nr:hypothetical protein [Bdellovibrio bacteriovorus]
MDKILVIVLAILLSSPSRAVTPAEKPYCGVSFLNDFKKHYGIIDCLSRGDHLCVSDRVHEKSTTAFASTAGATGAAAAKLASSKFAPAIVRQGAQTAGSKIAWAAVAGGTYFIATKAIGGVFGFLADSSEAGECRDNHPWILYVKGKRGCEIGYKIADNPVAANFFNLQNESEQLALFKDERVCEYFYRLHQLIIAKGEAAAVEQGIDDPTLFQKSPRETVTTPKTSRLPQKADKPVDAKKQKGER